ncbi:MAG: hypothetical protein KBD16_03730 [Candidatus Pacebacteria bacterium]|nr:hypothetical protein [Candidatus Paceibacterota bacterium]
MEKNRVMLLILVGAVILIFRRFQLGEMVVVGSVTDWVMLILGTILYNVGILGAGIIWGKESKR